MGFFKKLFGAALKRPVKNWNVENRAQSAIEKQMSKPVIAPKHPTTAKMIDDFRAENPDLLNLQREKSEKLHKMLDGLVVNPQKTSEIISRSRGNLPADKDMVNDDEYGYFEPEKIPEGKCTIRQSLKFIADHQSDPEKHSVEDIAEEYKLDMKDLKNVLHHFQTLQLHLPKTKDKTLSESKTIRVESGDVKS